MTKSLERMVRTSVRTSRETPNQPVAPMTTITPRSGAVCQTANTPSRSSTRGSESNASSTRIITASVRPPR